MSDAAPDDIFINVSRPLQAQAHDLNLLLLPITTVPTSQVTILIQHTPISQIPTLITNGSFI